MLDQIEKNVGRERFQLLPNEIDIVVDGQMFRDVTKRTERVHDVRFGLPILCLQLLAEILIKPGRTCAIEEHQHFEFLFHAFSISVIPTEVEESLIYPRDVSSLRIKLRLGT